METNSTHLIFDGEKIIVSPDLMPIMEFLQEIEREIQAFLGLDKKLESIKKQHLETIDLIQVMAGKLKENSIDFEFTLSEHPATIADKLKVYRPLRSEMIVLFANLETLFCLNIAYANKTADEVTIRNFARKQANAKAFYDEFCLTKNNEWYAQNLERAEHLTAENVRYLRNSLAHFFSVDKNIVIADSAFDGDLRQFEKKVNFQFTFISPEDLYQIVREAGRLIIRKWDADCRECLKTQSDDFKERILYVKNIIHKSGARIVNSQEINSVMKGFNIR